MKYSVILFLFMTATQLCGENPKIDISIKFYSNNGITEVYHPAVTGTSVTGTLFSNSDPEFVGSGEYNLRTLPDNYEKNKLDYLSGSYRSSIKDKENILPEKMLRYCIYTEAVTKNKDSVNLYMRFFFYKQTLNAGMDNLNYDVSFEEIFTAIPLNKPAAINYLNNVFPEADSIVVFIKLSGTAPEMQKLNVSDYKIDINSISPAAREFKKNTIAVSADYFRTDIKDNKVLLKQPVKITTEQNIIFSGTDNSLIFPMWIYSGLASVPFTVFDKQKSALLSKSPEYKNSREEVEIMLLPLQENNKMFSFRIVIKHSLLHGTYTYSKEISLKRGGKLKVELDKPAGLFRHEVIDGEDLYIDVEKDYSRFVNEYLVLSLK